ncbi:MAG TPA: hypothetical protein VL988_00120 [Solirubrobacteraceae bacterium]|nr:hypothetical protein [Solirubrobacteraceae bacterium]
MTPPAAATAASSGAAVRPRRAPSRPRRLSGPLRPATVPPRARAATTTAQPGLVLGLLAALESLSQHRLLDRLIRGRVWIGLVAFALIGIVTLQLGLLELNGGIGRALEHEATLQRENAALSIENSELAAGTRVQARAKKLGMTLAPVGALRFLTAGGHGDVAKAAAALASSAKAQAQAREAAAAEAASSSTSGEESSESEVSGEGGEAAGASSSSSGEAGGSSEASSESESGSSTEAAASSEAAGSGEAEPSGGTTAGE